MRNNVMVAALLKIAREVLAYHLGDEGWLLPNGTYLETTTFQGHTQLVIDWFISRYARGGKAQAKALFVEPDIDPKDWKKAGFPLADMHYFMARSYKPIEYAFDNGWIRMTEGGVELPDASHFRAARNFLLSRLGGIKNKSYPIYIDLHRGASFVTSVGEMMDDESVTALRRV